MQKKIQIFMEQYHMIEKGDRIVIGVSGGADSVCLLMALCSLQEKLGFQVLVCHVNHELRGEEAAQDEAYVEMLCHKMQVPFFAFHENVELIAKNGKKSLEEAGRIVRSNAFETVCRESGANKIATAHHKNDNAETVLLNLARGSGLQGMCGIRPVYGNRIRPLLCLTREEIEAQMDPALYVGRAPGQVTERSRFPIVLMRRTKKMSIPATGSGTRFFRLWNRRSTVRQ